MHPMKIIFLALTVLVISAPVIAEDQFSMSTGFDYSTGKYGTATSTDFLYIPVIGKYQTDSLTFKLTVPYISITGTGYVVPGVGPLSMSNGTTMGMGNPANSTQSTTSSGLGDVIASLGYNVYDGDTISFDIFGNVKFGTADVNKGLGTGKNDYSAQLDGYYSLSSTTFFATAGYKIYGAPAGVTLNNVPYGTIGVSQKISSESTVGIMLDMAQSPSTTGTGQKDVTVYISKKFTSNFKVQVNAIKGFSNGSPDFGGGAMITGIF